MEVFQTGQYHIKDLDRIQELQPLEFVQKSILKRLNYLIGFIKKEKPGLVTSFVIKLNNKFVSFLEPSYKTTKFQIPDEIRADYMHLKLYPELMENCIAYFLQLINFDYTRKWTKVKVKVSNRNYIQSFLHHRYYNAEALTEVIEKNQAVQLFKDYITAYVKSLAPEEPRYETLEEFREARRPKEGDSPSIGWVIVQGKIENGKYPQKKITCMWADAIQNLPDTELRYLAACYGDFQSYNNSNKNFILTMEHTIVEGYDYCDCVVHDISVNNDLTHPSKEFFNTYFLR